jgi:hypothetical protein
MDDLAVRVGDDNIDQHGAGAGMQCQHGRGGLLCRRRNLNLDRGLGLLRGLLGCSRLTGKRRRCEDDREQL